MEQQNCPHYKYTPFHTIMLAKVSPCQQYNASLPSTLRRNSWFTPHSLLLHILLQLSSRIYGLNCSFWFLLELSPSCLLFLKPLILDIVSNLSSIFSYTSLSLEIFFSADFVSNSLDLYMIFHTEYFLHVITSLRCQTFEDHYRLGLIGTDTKIFSGFAFLLTESLPFTPHWIKSTLMRLFCPY